MRNVDKFSILCISDCRVVKLASKNRARAASLKYQVAVSDPLDKGDFCTVIGKTQQFFLVERALPVCNLHNSLMLYHTSHNTHNAKSEALGGQPWITHCKPPSTRRFSRMICVSAQLSKGPYKPTSQAVFRRNRKN